MDAPRIADVVQRAGIEHHEVCAFAGRECAGVRQPKMLRGKAGGGADGLQRGHAQAHEDLQFTVPRIAEEMIAHCTCVGAQHDVHARRLQAGHALAQVLLVACRGACR